tara:strand:+ start:409 stop:792 length:384 start_codon:yes stop_codon:yes gene_type:complete
MGGEAEEERRSQAKKEVTVIIKIALVAIVLVIGCANNPRIIEKGGFDPAHVPRWFKEPPVDKRKAYAARTATGKTPQAAITRATIFAECSLQLHEADQMRVEKQIVFQENPVTYRAYVLAVKTSEGE